MAVNKKKMTAKTPVITIKDKTIIARITRLQRSSGDAYPGTPARRLLVQALNLTGTAPRANR